MKGIGILLILSLSIFLSCSNDDDDVKTIQMKVASNTIIVNDVISNLEVERLLLWDEINNRWQIITETISGFSYEKGYEYILKVKSTKIKNPPMDISNIRYTLIEVISKVKKDSENLPQ